MPNCPSCKSKDVVRNGFIHNGNQNHKCKACGRQFVEAPQQKLISQETKDPIDNLLLEKILLIPQSTANSQADEQTPTWKIKLLFDGECPLCVREVNFLKKQDRDRGLVKFVDIIADDYTPADNVNIDFETAMGRIHAVLPDGTIVKNVEVFRQTYDILGIGWIYAIIKLPLFGRLAETIYGIWADSRLLLTGRDDLKTIVAKRQQRMQQSYCTDRCSIETQKK